MARNRLPLLLVGLFAIHVCSVVAHVQELPCGCWQVLEGDDITCHSAGGCSSYYTSQYCDVGCNFGHCGPMGYGSCCSTSWRTYNVYGATQCGGNQDCGNGCG